MRRTLSFVVIGTLALLPGCVELDGQRICLRYVADRDELQFLLFYDGVHDSKSKGQGEVVDQLTKFVASGDVLLLDWPMHFDREAISNDLQKLEKESPALMDLGRTAVDSIRSVPLGHYRDEKGRIGAAQMLVVSKASVLFGKLNALLNHEILTGEPERELRPIVDRMREGARRGEQWLRIDGHSIVMSAPVRPREWARMKAEALMDILGEAEEGYEEADSEDTRRLFLLQLLSLSPVSIEETPERLTIRLGTKSRPSTFRFRLRESEKTGLDNLLAKLVPENLDERVADALLSGEPEKADPLIRAVIEWGPAEERARALLRRVENGTTVEGRRAAAGRLAEFGAAWNRDHGDPEAPSPREDGTTDVAAWKMWYARMVRFPG